MSNLINALTLGLLAGAGPSRPERTGYGYSHKRRSRAVKRRAKISRKMRKFNEQRGKV